MESMETYNPIIKKCALFRSIEEKDYGNLLQCMNAQRKTVPTGGYLFIAGDRLNYIGIVLSGVIEVIKESMSGSNHIVAFLEGSDIFGEGIVCTRERIAPVTVRAKVEAAVLLIPYERITKSCGNSCAFHVSLIQNMMEILGEKNLLLNRKLELLMRKGMREKIAFFLLNVENARKSSIFQIVLNRTEMAEYLNVSRTSMCRELARMKEEGLIDFYGNSFKILNREKLVENLN